jgi:anti-sigma-K factor RskA
MNESLQLWLISKGQSYSVGIFHPQPGKKFYSLNKIPHIPFDEIEMFRMTKEPASGSEFPSGSTVYFGAFPVK